MSFKGGGDAGGRAPSRAGPEYVRQIPKFLQKYEHLLEKREGQRTVHVSSGGEAAPAQQVVDDEDDTFEDQIRGATIVHDERDASTAPSCSTAAEGSPEWTKLKDQGNAAFTKGEHKEALRLFSEALKLEPKNSVLYSNRSAAHAAMKRFQEALADAKKALQLQPGWGKAYSRIGAALFGLQKFEEAIETYEKALKLEPKNKTYQEALEQAKKRQKEAEEKEAESGKHVFRKRKSTAGNSKDDLKEDKSATERVKKSKGVKTGMLSFEEE